MHEDPPSIILMEICVVGVPCEADHPECRLGPRSMRDS